MTIAQGPHCLAAICPHRLFPLPPPCNLRLVPQHLPHRRPGTTLRWCDEILSFFSAILYQQEKEEICLSVCSQPMACLLEVQLSV